MKKFILAATLVLSAASAFADDGEFHHYGCSAVAIATANAKADSIPSTVASSYWITQSFVTTKMDAAYEIIMRNRDDGQCALIKVTTFLGATDCSLLSAKTIKLSSLKPNDGLQSLCK